MRSLRLSAWQLGALVHFDAMAVLVAFCRISLPLPSLSFCFCAVSVAVRPSSAR